jgi:phage terminase large subunit
MAKASKILRKNADAYNKHKYRIIANKGGTRSTKTWSLLQLMLTIATSQKVLVSVVSESMPHLRKGAMRDFEQILEGAQAKEDKHYTHNRTGHVYGFPNGGKIEFFSADSYTKVHGAQRDILFINECNNIPYEVFVQLAMRTTGIIFLDYNPAAVFWCIEQVETRPNCITIVSTYKDNEFLSKEQVEEMTSGMVIDGRKTQPCDVHVITRGEGRVVLEVILREGRNRQIRKMCEKLGLEVARLKRTQIGQVKLGMLPQGKWRDLTQDEVRRLTAQPNTTVITENYK